MKASPDIKIPEPRISKFVFFILKSLTRLYLFLYYGIASTMLRGEKVLFDVFKRTLAGESRSIIAFRHPNGGEPQLLTWFFLSKLKRLAAKQGVRFSRQPHAVFVYSYDVVRWGGWVARFIMPNVGAMPIYHVKVDIKGMGHIYKSITDGPYPVALAPEGSISYTADYVPRLEPGIIRIGFNAAKKLAEKNKDCPLEIVPLSVHFRYGFWGKMNMKILLKKTEKYCGFCRKESAQLPFAERLQRCRNHILEVNENRYNIKNDSNFSFEERIQRLAYTALETAERMLGLKNEDDFFTRVHRIRQIYWDRIFLPDVKNADSFSRIEQSVKDLGAGEGWYIARHVELADFCWYFNRPIPAKDAVLHSRIEYLHNLWDFANRTMGGAHFNRIDIFPRKVVLQTGPVINLTERLPRYKEDKKAAIAEGLADLNKAYVDCINEMNNWTGGVEK